MIHIGLTGFGDHEELYGKLKPAERLRTYAAHFPVVEIDSFFYAVQPLKNTEKWTRETPDGFGFIVKAYQGMTGHLRGNKNYYDTDEDMFEAFHASIAPMREAGKLVAALFQYPPWFECTRDNVARLRKTRAAMKDVPCALEFRHQSWFWPEYREKTLAFMREEGWINTVVDEPAAGEGTIPTVSVATSPDIAYVRLHGRNARGWVPNGNPKWRKVRYLYRYSTEELAIWRDRLLHLEREAKDVYVVFNNNSGGDATDNARELIRLVAEASASSVRVLAGIPGVPDGQLVLKDEPADGLKDGQEQTAADPAGGRQASTRNSAT